MTKTLLIILLLIPISFQDKNTYPKKKDIKGIQPDGQDPNQMIGNGVSTVAFNLPWFLCLRT